MLNGEQALSPGLEGSLKKESSSGLRHLVMLLLVSGGI